MDSRDQSANIIISCVDKPLEAAFDVPAPRVEWAVNPSIPSLDSTDFNQRAMEAEETGLWGFTKDINSGPSFDLERIGDGG